jgi:ureidoglycolate lyase
MGQQKLKIRTLSQKNFSSYGEVIELKGAEELVINQGTTTRFNALAFVDVGEEGGVPIISIFEGKRRPDPIKLVLMERHPLGSQAFFPLSNHGWIVVVCKSNGSGEKPDLSTIECFYARGDQGVSYLKGTWHHPLIVLEASQKFLVVDRQGDGCNLNEFSIENLDINIGPDNLINSTSDRLIKLCDSLLCSWISFSIGTVVNCPSLTIIFPLMIV